MNIVRMHSQGMLVLFLRSLHDVHIGGDLFDTDQDEPTYQF